MSQQSRSQETQAIFIDTVGRHLMERGETALKLSGICTEVGMTQTAIYYHFGSREAVIDAAYLHLFHEITQASLSAWTSIASEKTPTTMFNRYVALRDDASSFQLHRYRQLMHLRILSASTVRRTFKVKYDAANAAYMASLTNIFEVVQERGLLNTKVSARQLAMMVQYAMVSQSFWGHSTSPEELDEWDATMRQLFDLITV